MGDYRGFPRNPDLQLRWFTDTAMLVRQRRVAEGRPDPADDPAALRELDRRRRAAGPPVPLALPDPPRGGARPDRRASAPRRSAGDTHGAAPASPDRDDAAAAQHRRHHPQCPLSGQRLPHRCDGRDRRRVCRSCGARAARERIYAADWCGCRGRCGATCERGARCRARVTAIAADNAANTTTRSRLVTLRG